MAESIQLMGRVKIQCVESLRFKKADVDDRHNKEGSTTLVLIVLVF